MTLAGLFLKQVGRRHKRRGILQRDEPRRLDERLVPLSHYPLIPHDYDRDDAAVPDFRADSPPPLPSILLLFLCLIGTGAGFGERAGSAVRGWTPKQTTRASEGHWYDGS